MTFSIYFPRTNILVRISSTGVGRPGVDPIVVGAVIEPTMPCLAAD